MLTAAPDLFTKVGNNAFFEPVQAILKTLSQKEEVTKEWEHFFTSHFHTVATQLIGDDCSQDLNFVLNHENYIQLQQFIDDKNKTLENLSQYIRLSNLSDIWNKVERNRKLTFERQLLLKLLFKLAVAYVLLNRLENSEDDINLSPEQKNELISPLRNSIQRLYSQSLSIPTFPDPKPLFSNQDFQRALVPGAVIWFAIKEMISEATTFIRNIPKLLQADLTLLEFWRNLLWVNFRLAKVMIGIPFVVLFTLPIDLTLSLRSLLHREQSTEIALWEKCAVTAAGLFSLWLILLSSVKAAGFGLTAANTVNGLTGFLVSVATYFGAPLITAGLIAVGISTFGILAGLGIYRSLILPLKHYFSQISWINRSEVKDRIVKENQENFNALFDFEPEFTALFRVPVHISFDDQVILSNADLDEIKLRAARLRFDHPSPAMQEELQFKHEKLLDELQGDPAINAQLISFEKYKDITSKVYVKRIETSEVPVIPRFN